MGEFVRVEIDQAIATIRLERPPMNALSVQAQAELAQAAAEVDADPALGKRVLQEVEAYDSPSMPSLVSYLSAEFPKDQVQRAIDSLEKGGFVKLSPKEQKSGRAMLTLELTERGTELLGRLA